MAKAALFAAALVLSTFASKPARAYDLLTMGGGPVLSPDIVPLFWGSWTSGDKSNTDRKRIRAYIDGFAQYISGNFNPIGMEPVLKQYGVWGATRNKDNGGDFFDPGTNDTHIRNTGIYQRIELLQSQGKLPKPTPNRVYVVFLRGFTYDFTDASGWDNTDCAYHSLNNGNYYAVVPVDWPGWGPVTVNGKQTVGLDNHCQVILTPKTNTVRNNIPGFENLISHELGEAMTDPYPANGWVTNDFPFGFNHSEAGDFCESSSTTLTFSDGYTGTQPGTVQMFNDNLSQGCASFTSMTTSRLGVMRGFNGIVDLFYPDGWPGELAHVTENWDGTWTEEFIAKSGATQPMLYAPAAVVPNTQRTDVFAMGGDGVLEQITKSGTGNWTFKAMPSSSSVIGQPAAAVTDQDFLEVAIQERDSSVGHYAWSDTKTPSLTSLGGQTIGPPVIVSHGSRLLDVFTYGMHADVVENSENSGVFSGYHVLVAGSNDNTPYPPGVVPWDVNHEDVYIRGTPGSVVTRFNSSWSGKWSSFGSPSSGTYTKMAVATARNTFTTGEYDVVWENPDTTYSALHVSNNGATFGAITSLGSQRYWSPPTEIYGADGWPYIFGMGNDGCLYFNQVDWWGGGGPTGAIWTGFCDQQ